MAQDNQQTDIAALGRLIRVARGEEPADLLVTGGELVNVISGEVYPANVAICDGRVAGIGPEYTEGREVINASGRFVLPGLIDAHMHLESSLLTPAQFARAVLPHGTTAVVVDPHELANVMGMDGVRYILEASDGLPLDLFAMASSCVPATHMETAGAAFGSAEIGELLGWDRVIGVAEMMNVPAVLSGEKEALNVLANARARRVPVDGHAPGLSGMDLVAYAAAGVRSDHECTTPEEAAEKLRLGMWLMIREGSAARNMEALLPVVTDANHRRCLLVSDDTHAHDLVRRGHMNHALREAVRLGLDPVRAVQMVTINAAEAMGLGERGALVPGYRADLVLVDDLTAFKVSTVVKDGKLAVQGGDLIAALPVKASPAMYDTVRTGDITVDHFRIPFNAHDEAHVIGLTRSQLVTEDRLLPLKVVDGHAVSDPARDILKVAVIERHKATGNVGLGFVQGLGLNAGAIASSVSHDSHNLIVVGTNDADMLSCVDQLRQMGGGFVAMLDGKVKGVLPLPIAGLLSDAPLEEVVEQGAKMREVAARLGIHLPAPFISLSFLALPVIPELKITDHGLVNVTRFQLTDLLA
ncbi:MAG: adenine deaminase [Leptospirillia bacterium]